MNKDEIRNILQEKYEKNNKKYKYNFNENEFDKLSLKLFESSKHFINTFDYDLGNAPGIGNKIKRFLKRTIRKSTRFILKPYAEKMYRFQELNGEITGTLTEYAKYSNNLLNYSQKEIDSLKQGLHNSENNFQNKLIDLAHNSQTKLDDFEHNVQAKLVEMQNKLINFESTLWNIIKEKDKVQEELSKYESYSQTGEDRIVDFLLNYGGNAKKGISYLDIGCNDWRNLSNSYYLYRRGIRGVLIDANPIYVEEIKIFRPEDTVLNCGIGKEHSKELEFNIVNQSDVSSFNIKTIEEAKKRSPWLEIVKKIKVPVYTLDEIYEKYFVKVPTIVSLDVEGDELGILESSNFEKYRPYIFIIETIEYREKISLDNKRNDIVEFMKKNNYEEYAFTGVNSIFIDKRAVE
jgi:methyltransferase, fkbM family